MSFSLILLAAGKSNRFKSKVPKPYHKLGGKTLLEISLSKFRQFKEIKKISGNEKNTTNNRMELLAPINALKDMKPGVEIKIYTDSQYVKNGITEWINSWLANNWKTSKKEDVKNKDLWLELYNLNQSLDVNWNWVKAHDGNPLNEEVDLLAKQAANLN